MSTVASAFARATAVEPLGDGVLLAQSRQLALLLEASP
jgi:hypothetical protein